MSDTTFWKATYEVARKEVLQHLRTKRLLIIGPIFMVAMVLMTIVLPLVLINQNGGDALRQAAPDSLQNIALLFFFSGLFFLSGYFYFQLIPILLTADAVCSEWSHRTVFLLLSKPVSRTAFVLGKLAGSFATVAGVVIVALGLDYVALQIFLPGHSDFADVGRFFAALGILLLGVLAYASVSLLMSTLTKSATMAILSSVMLWIIVFPLLSSMDFFVALLQHGLEIFGSGNSYPHWSAYLSPGSSMATAGDVLSPLGPEASRGALGLLAGGGATTNVWGAVAALVVQTILFVALSIVVVRRRNFE
ncbi:MAG: ABC transporter permease [Thermoplasmatota archaeon]